MALIGGRDTRDIVVATGVDAAELKRLTLQDGTTYDAIVQELTGAITALNASLNADPIYAGMSSQGDSVEVAARMGAAAAFDDFTEYTTGDANRAQRDGWMLPLYAADFKLAWTWDYMRKAYFAQIQDDIAMAVTAAQNLRRKRMLNRLLSRTDDSGVSKGLGTGGYSPGFATAAANTNVDFTPPEFNGKTFTSNHDHYTFAATSKTSATVVAMMKTLREHGFVGPYELICSESDYDTVKGFSDFVPAGDPLVQYGVTTSLAIQAFDNGLGGYLKDSMARVRMIIGWPDEYFTLYKSFGANNPNNPLRIRLPKGETALRFAAFPDPRTPSPANPLGSMVVWTEFGVGVGNRLAAATNRNNAAWADGSAA